MRKRLETVCFSILLAAELAFGAWMFVNWKGWLIP